MPGVGNMEWESTLPMVIQWLQPPVGIARPPHESVWNTEQIL